MAETVASLALQLSAADLEVRIQAAEALSQLGEEAQGAAVALVRACGDDEEDLSEAATSALEALGPPASGDAKALVALLADANVDVAYWAATLLGRLGEDAEAAVPALVKSLEKDGRPAICERAAWALGQIGSPAKDAVGALQKAAKHSNPRLSRLAAEALDSIGG